MSSATLNIPTPIRDISCQDLLRNDVSKHGVLRLRGAFNKVVDNFVTKSTGAIIKVKWPCAHVVLHRGCLYIYHSETASSATKATSLYGFNAVMDCSDELAHVKVSWPFKLVSEIEYNERAFYFSAPSRTEMEKWISAIKEQMMIANSGRVMEERSRPSLPAIAGMSLESSKGIANRPRQLTPDELARLNYHADVRPAPVSKNETTDDSDGSDYEEIKDEDNRTDDSKIRRPPVNLPVSPGSGGEQMDQTSHKHLAVKLPMPGSNLNPLKPVGLNKGPKSPPMEGSTKPIVPLKPATSKPPVMAKKPGFINELQTKVAERTDELPAGYYAVNEMRSVYDDTDEKGTAEYMGGEDCTAMDGSLKREMPRERSVDEAFWPNSPEEGEQLMRTLVADGIYMIRQSKDTDSQTLLVRIENNVRKYKIFTNEDGEFAVNSNGPWFRSRTLLLRHYKTYCLPKQEVKLTDPYSVCLRK